MENWYAQGGDHYDYYNLCTGWSADGLWGLTEVIENLTTPKYEAMMELITMPRPQIVAGTAVAAAGGEVTVPIADDVWGWTEGETYYVYPDQEAWFLFRADGDASCEVQVGYVPGSWAGGALTYDIRVNGVLQGSIAADGSTTPTPACAVSLPPGLAVVSVQPSVSHLIRSVTLRTLSVQTSPFAARAPAPHSVTLTNDGRHACHLTFPGGGPYQVLLTDLGGRLVQRTEGVGTRARLPTGNLARGLYHATALSRGQRSVHTLVH
jgi:hypothetical protein